MLGFQLFATKSFLNDSVIEKRYQSPLTINPTPSITNVIAPGWTKCLLFTSMDCGEIHTRCLLETVHSDPQIPGRRLTRKWRNVLGLSQTEPSRPGTRIERAIVQLSPESRQLLWVCKKYSWSSLFYLKPYVFLFTFRLVFLFWLNLLILYSVTLNNSTVPERARDTCPLISLILISWAARHLPAHLPDTRHCLISSSQYPHKDKTIYS